MYLCVLKLHHNHIHVCIFVYVCFPAVLAQSSVTAWVAVSGKRTQEKFFLTSTPHFLLPDVTDEPMQLTHIMNRNACVTGWQDSGTSQKSLLISKNKLGWLLFILDVDIFAHIKNWDPSWTLVTAQQIYFIALLTLLTLLTILHEYKVYYRFKVPPSKTLSSFFCFVKLTKRLQYNR